MGALRQPFPAKPLLTELETPSDGDVLRIQSTDRVPALETSGVRANRAKNFALSLSGSEIYALLDYLEKSATRQHDNFHLVREAVLLAELIRVRARKVGF